MERLKAAIVVYVALRKTSENKTFFDVCLRDMDNYYHHLLLSRQKVDRIQKEWGVKSAMHFLGHIALLQDGPGGNVATQMQTRSNNLGHHNDNHIYSLVDSELCWELGNDGT